MAGFAEMVVLIVAGLVIVLLFNAKRIRKFVDRVRMRRRIMALAEYFSSVKDHGTPEMQVRLLELRWLLQWARSEYPGTDFEKEVAQISAKIK